MFAKYFVDLLNEVVTMKSSWIIFVLFSSFALHARETITSVSEIEISPNIHEHSLIFLSSGEVTKLMPVKSEMLEQLIAAEKHQDVLKIEINDAREITKVEKYQIKTNISNYDLSGKSLDYEKPTVLNSIDLAQKYFNGARYNKKESQCFNRAHVWSYEWKTKNRLNTSKMFIFFSRKYIREHDFGWWFHVAPYLHVVIGQLIKERIMDRKYMAGPSTLREWIDRLIEDGTQCRTIKKYSEYANYPESGNCYLMRSSMYSYWPLDLEQEELLGTKKTSWVPEEIEQAYMESFDIITNQGMDVL